MIKLITTIFVAAIVNTTFAQCPLNDTHTDPNQYTEPQNSGFKTNTFEWWMNPVEPINKYFIPGGGTTDPYSGAVTSPYNASAAQLQFIDQNPNPGVIQNFVPDYTPQNGWELIKQDLGWFYNATANPSAPWAGEDLSMGASCTNTNTAYILLYNKYEAKLRLFGILPNQSGGVVQVNLSFVPHETVATDNLSGLFNQFNNPTEQSLDEQTNTAEVSAMGWLPDAENSWFFVDFPMAYDPCTCFFQSEIQVDFQLILSGTLTATGASLGVTVSNNVLNPSNLPFSPFSPNQVFALNGLSSSQYNSIVQEYNSTLNFAEAVSNNTGLDATAATGVLNAVKDIAGGLASFSTGDDNPLGFLGITAAQAGGLSDILNLFSVSQNDYPLVTSSQIALTGTVTLNTLENSSEFIIANPGSLNASTDPEYGSLTFCGTDETRQNVNYPMYNNPMGLFALLKSPVINHSLNVQTIPDADGNLKVIQQYQLSSDQIQYSLNPIVDASKTQIYAALEIQSTMNSSEPSTNAGDYTLDYNLQVENNGMPITSDAPFHTFRTRFFPLSCLSNLIEQEQYVHNNTADPGFDPGSVPIVCNIIFSVVYAFDNDEYGNAHATSQVFKYPLVVNSECSDENCFISSSLSSNAFPTNLTINTETLGASGGPTTIYSYGTITIDGDITTSNSSTLYYIIAEQAIIVTPGSTVAPNVVLETSPFPPNLCTQPNTTPTLVDNTYCTSSSYIANQASKRGSSLLASTTPIKMQSSKAFSTSIYPNPATNELNINVKGLEDGPVNINLYDELGSLVYTQEFQSYGTAQNKFNISGLNLADGIYLVKTTNGDNINNQKLVIAK